ncbi:hypothetical protein AURDEDRAFT_133681 [Auricularia subglabra TFB-10046 SS5]|nr:hypothetical protein AURDEDRAFT_133681 [Auricularia subglabra TFB-10046 SS5]
MPQNPSTSSLTFSSTFANPSMTYVNAPKRLEDQYSPIVRCEDVWFSDGNIVIAVVPLPNSCTPVHAFRVHKSVLSAMSDVWRGMFALAQPRSEVETFADTEVVRFHDDSPDDMREFLQVVYCQRFLPSAQLQGWRTTERAVAGPLRIATKYAAHNLRERIVQILEADWPLTLEAWNANEKVTRSRMESLDLRECFPEPASIIRLARDCNVPSILPAAFYHLNELYREDDSKLDIDKRQYEPSLLSLADMHALVVGRESMRSFLCKWLIELPISYSVAETGPACLTSPNKDGRRCCDAIHHWWMRDFLEPSLQRILWPIDHLELFQRELETDPRICTMCRGWLAAQFQHACSVIWRALPEWFLLEESTTTSQS